MKGCTVASPGSVELLLGGDRVRENCAFCWGDELLGQQCYTTVMLLPYVVLNLKFVLEDAGFRTHRSLVRFSVFIFSPSFPLPHASFNCCGYDTRFCDVPDEGLDLG